MKTLQIEVELYKAYCYVNGLKENDAKSLRKYLGESHE